MKNPAVSFTATEPSLTLIIEDLSRKDALVIAHRLNISSQRLLQAKKKTSKGNDAKNPITYAAEYGVSVADVKALGTPCERILEAINVTFGTSFNIQQPEA